MGCNYSKFQGDIDKEKYDPIKKLLLNLYESFNINNLKLSSSFDEFRKTKQNTKSFKIFPFFNELARILIVGDLISMKEITMIQEEEITNKLNKQALSAKNANNSYQKNNYKISSHRKIQNTSNNVYINNNNTSIEEDILELDMKKKITNITRTTQSYRRNHFASSNFNIIDFNENKKVSNSFHSTKENLATNDLNKQLSDISIASKLVFYQFLVGMSIDRKKFILLGILIIFLSQGSIEQKKKHLHYLIVTYYGFSDKDIYTFLKDLLDLFIYVSVHILRESVNDTFSGLSNEERNISLIEEIFMNKERAESFISKYYRNFQNCELQVISNSIDFPSLKNIHNNYDQDNDSRGKKNHRNIGSYISEKYSIASSKTVDDDILIRENGKIIIIDKENLNDDIYKTNDLSFTDDDESNKNIQKVNYKVTCVNKKTFDQFIYENPENKTEEKLVCGKFAKQAKFHILIIKKFVDDNYEFFSPDKIIDWFIKDFVNEINN